MKLDIKRVLDKIKLILIQFLQGNGLIISVAILVIIVIAIFKKIDNKPIELISLSTFSSIVVSVALAFIVSLLRRLFYNFHEDTSKLTTNYNKLIKIYASENQVVSQNNVTIACVKVADLSNGAEIRIHDNPFRYYELPGVVENYYKDLFNSHLTSTKYNNVNIRVKKWQLNDDCFDIYTERTTYYDSLVTNRAMDYRLDNGMSVRSIYAYGPILRPLQASRLSNHLGFNGMLETSDGYFPFVYRKDSVSIGKRTYGCSVEASMKFVHACDSNDHFMITKAGMENAFVSEIKDELGITVDSLRILCAYRDLLEGGKPQLFLYYKIQLKMEEVDYRLKQANAGENVKKDNSDNDNSKQEMRTDGYKLVWVSKETFLDPCKTQIYNDRITTYITEKGELKERSLIVLPSTAASVVFLIDYLNKQ